MASSIAEAERLAALRHSRLVLVLGEMLELGAQSEREHECVGQNLPNASVLIAVGELAEPLFASASRAGIQSELCADATDAAKRVAALVRPNDVVLVKGSRGVRLETVVRALEIRKGRAA